MLNIAVLVSGGGTNLQALLDSEARGENPNGKITLVVASKPGVYALERAAKAGVESCVVRRRDYDNSEDFDAALLGTLKAHNIDLVVLAGFLSVLGPSVIAAYPRRILNVHPALIPSFCGPGMYGLRPHEAALARGCKVTGATVHFVNEECDGGPILLQKAVDILPGDTPEVLQQRVMEQAEWQLLPKAVAMVCSGEIERKNKLARPLRPLRVQLSQRESPWQNHELCVDCQSLPLWGRWQRVSADGEGEVVIRKGEQQWKRST